MPDRTKTALTPAQRAHLTMLLDAGALSRETARDPFEPGMAGVNPNVVGILREKGFAESRRRKSAGGSQVTAYWLTMAGHGLALSIAKGRI